MNNFKPYANERDALHIGNLKIENRLDRVSFYGDVDFTRDQVGLAAARELKIVVDGIVSTLDAENLPEKLPAPTIKTVKNPF